MKSRKKARKERKTSMAGAMIRKGSAADLPWVLPMVRAICAMHAALDPERFAMLPDVVERYERWLPERAADVRSVFLVACVGEKPVGFIVGTVEASVPIYALSEFGFIHDVWVEPDVRGEGVASALVDGAIAAFRVMGVGQVRLETALANPGARALFERAGFRAATVEMLTVLA